MMWEYIENNVQLLCCLAALLLALFQYITHKQKEWIYAVIIFLSCLMSCYNWTAYLLIMGDSPNISDLFSYFGWNVMYAVMLLLTLRVKTREERRWFHPLILLPVPLNLWQLSLYLPYGGVLNSVYQVTVMTLIECSSLQSLLWYRFKRGAGAQRPYVSEVLFLCALFEFGMWTSSCYGGFISNFYYVFSILCSGCYLGLVWAIKSMYRQQSDHAVARRNAEYQIILKSVYLIVVLVCCVGGIMLGGWMRNLMSASLESGGSEEIYNIIPVVLFIISLFLVALAVAIIFVVSFGEKIAENNQLREDRRIAELANTAKSDFLANMSHEIRTPINAVLGMNEMILHESLQARDLLPKEREVIRGIFSDICGYSSNIDSAGKNLLSIINDILDFSKIEAGKLSIVETDYKLSSVLNDVSNMIAFKARDKELDFRVEVDENLPDGLHGDEVRVRQIITNLLNNAVKYTQTGSVKLSMHPETGAPAAAGGTLRLIITVEDTGIGIRPEDLDRLFQKFERVDLQKNSTVEGTGLGLAITHSLLDMMGGSITVESTYGKGSVFTAVLPQRVVSVEPVGDFQKKFKSGLEAMHERREAFRAPDAHILIVDDTRMNLTVAESLLKKTGIEIDSVLSGPEAIVLCRSIRYDLILMDQRMPGMDGTEAMRQIRAQTDGLNTNTPFICLTADAVSGARNRYLALGFTDYLSKPIDSRTLEKMLMDYLPKDKVLVEKDAATDARAYPDEQPAQELRESLAAAGIDSEVGLQYCGQDTKMYEMLLREFALGAQGRLRELERACGAEDWKSYAIQVHALKSTSKMIGAASLSELAARSEAAADAGQAERVRRDHDEIMTQYAAIAETISLHLAPADSEAETEDGEILEFLPEEQ